MGDLNQTRRGFLQGAAALSFGLVLNPKDSFAAGLGTEVSPDISHEIGNSFSPNAILRIESDNTVRIIMPHAEMGQGAYTGMAQILADELDAEWGHVVAEHLESLDAAFNHQAWGTIATGASTSVSNQWTNLREVGATARAMLVEAASNHWNVPVSTLTTSHSKVIDEGNQREIGYGELTGAAAKLTPPSNITLKKPEEYSLIGKSVQRVDAMSKSNGQATFGMDLQLPNMLSAAIAHPKVFGGRVKSFDASTVLAMPGVRKVVEIPTGIAVVADSFWQAKVAKDALVIEWDDGEFANISSSELWQQYSDLADTKGPKFEQRGNVNFAKTQQHIEGEFRFPFLAHAPMEPLNATVQLTDDHCEIWSGTQFQGIDVVNLEKLTGIDRQKIKINTQWLGGSFGRRAAPQADFLVEAVQIAKASKLPNPIKMIWQREDDVQGGFYRPMVLHRFKIGLDETGLPTEWAHTVVGASISIGTAFEDAFMVDGLDSLSTEGLRHNHYHIDNVNFELHTPKHPVEVLWLRSEADSHTGPTVETIMNRLARATDTDPFMYRKKLLKRNPGGKRMIGVLDALEKASQWRTPAGQDIFRGIAVHESFGSVAGYVVELRKIGTKLSFHKVTAAMDCGRVINPESVKAQIYSSVAFALSTVIGQKVEIAKGRAVQSNFHNYKVAGLSEVPDVDVVLVDSELGHPTGVGEVGVPPFIPALTEAVYLATDQEVNEFPMELKDFSFLGA
jgi:isoquinoline 1-oxidoreductase subunit beta